MTPLSEITIDLVLHRKLNGELLAVCRRHGCNERLQSRLTLLEGFDFRVPPTLSIHYLLGGGRFGQAERSLPQAPIPQS